jgi:ATP/maltotriose-dependent transcriptional regulator MalT
MLAERGEHGRAAIVLAHAVTARDPPLLADLARAELAAGDADAARAFARRAYGWQRANGRVAEALARALQPTEPRQAAALLAKARATGPLLASR